MKHPVVLIILDGWGIGAEDTSNPIYAAKPQNLISLSRRFPVSSLEASGINVGLPWGETGNSEVGHLTLGAGKVLYQHFPRISMAIRDGSFFENKVLKDTFAHARTYNSAVNLVGILSQANAHASLEHLQALLVMAEKEKTPRVRLHLFADGKDSPPRSILKLLQQVPAARVATLTGRYYAMDREGNWELTRAAYENLTTTAYATADSPEKTAGAVLDRGLTEEFLPPVAFGRDSAVADNDALIFFNFREDSIHQLAEAFLDAAFDKFPVQKFANLFIATFTRYAAKLKVPVAFPPDAVKKPLGQVISAAGRTQLRLAETYKYAHVTSFFNGYREQPFLNEYRVVIPSRAMPHPEEHPEMMAPAITDRLVQSVQSGGFDFILTNYANPDTIGHTGNYEAAIKVVTLLDREIQRVLDAVVDPQTVVILTGDHGNLERVFNPVTGRVETQHDPNPVPFLLIGREFAGRRFYNSENLSAETAGSLADIAPTILELMNISQPPEMTGRSLLKELL